MTVGHFRPDPTAGPDPTLVTMMVARLDATSRNRLATLAVLAAALPVLASCAAPAPSGRILPPPAAVAPARPARTPPVPETPPVAETPSPAAAPVGLGSSVDLSNASPQAAVGAPTALHIPAIGVDAAVRPVGQNTDGSAQVPTGFTFAGWYDLGPKPGQIGPAVILGHVDSTIGPAVFFRLKSLLPGDAITVEDGSAPVSFEVQQVVTYAKDHFPTGAVFGPTPDVELRLITCGGPFDRSVGHYEDNVVVFARATDG